MDGYASFLYADGGFVDTVRDEGGNSKMGDIGLDAASSRWVRNGFGGSEKLFRILQGRSEEEGGHVDNGFRRGWRRKNVEYRNVSEGDTVHAAIWRARWVPA